MLPLKLAPSSLLTNIGEIISATKRRKTERDGSEKL